MRNKSGQLLLPMMAVLFLFGLFWVTFVFWSRRVYWKMRMDMAADATALSAARQQAEVLNYIATIQTLENAFLPEVDGYGVMDASMKSDFEGLNDILRIYKDSFGDQVKLIAQQVALANGSNMPVLPAAGSSYAENSDPRLEAHRVRVLYVADGWPVGVGNYPQAYYTRRWSPTYLKAQPDHKSYWTVCYGTVCGSSKAGLWLDVDPSSALNDGGFPSADASLLRSIGIQCFYPQFNAYLLPKNG